MQGFAQAVGGVCREFGLDQEAARAVARAVAPLAFEYAACVGDGRHVEVQALDYLLAEVRDTARRAAQDGPPPTT